MALTYTQDNPYSIANKNMSLIPQVAPANMTLIPNAQKPNILASLVPTTKGSMSAYSKSGYEISVPAETPLSALGSIPSSVMPSVMSNVETPVSSTQESQSNIPEISIKTLGSGNPAFDVWAKMRGMDYNDPKTYEKYIRNAGYAKMGSAALSGVASLLDASSATDYRREVEKTKDQYETQKKIIDTNIDKTESALMENLMSNMADLDVMSAAKNVDLSSQAIAGDKAKGAMDLGKDIADMRTNGALQKAALDLEYAMNVRKAKQAEINSYINAGLQIASSAISLL